MGWTLVIQMVRLRLGIFCDSAVGGGGNLRAWREGYVQALRGLLGLRHMEVSPLRTTWAGDEGNETAPLLSPGCCCIPKRCSVCAGALEE